MPRGDVTGPMSMGPMTGRAAGYCAGYSVPGFMNPSIYGRGGAFMRGAWGRGRGHRHMYYATGLPFWARYWQQPGYAPYYQGPNPVTPLSKEEQLNMLKSQAEMLKQEMDEINKAIIELEKQEQGDKE